MCSWEIARAQEKRGVRAQTERIWTVQLTVTDDNASYARAKPKSPGARSCLDRDNMKRETHVWHAPRFRFKKRKETVSRAGEWKKQMKTTPPKKKK